MSFIGALNFYTKVIEKLHIYLNRLLENTPWNWTQVHERLFHQLKMLGLQILNLQSQIQNTQFLLQLTLH